MTYIFYPPQFQPQFISEMTSEEFADIEALGKWLFEVEKQPTPKKKLRALKQIPPTCLSLHHLVYHSQLKIERIFKHFCVKDLQSLLKWMNRTLPPSVYQEELTAEESAQFKLCTTSVGLLHHFLKQALNEKALHSEFGFQKDYKEVKKAFAAIRQKGLIHQ